MSWLLWVTLRPDGYFTPNNINLTPLAEHGWALTCLVNPSCIFQRPAFRFLFVDVVGNMLVFAPLGFGLAGALYQTSLWQTIGRAALGGFSLSLIIELSQLFIPSRSTDVDDLFFNTLGATLGALGFVLLQRASNNRIANAKAAGKKLAGCSPVVCPRLKPPGD